MDHVTLGSGTFQDISDVLAFTIFEMCIPNAGGSTTPRSRRVPNDRGAPNEY